MPATFNEVGALLVDISGGTFIGLGDTPAAYAGNANRVLCVNATPDAVAFASNLYWDEVNDRLGVGTAAPVRKTHAIDESASTNVIIPISRIESQVSGGVGAAGHGPGFEYTGETTTTEDTLMVVTAARWSVATHASRRARFELRNYYIANEVLCGVIEAPATASPDGNARGVGAVDLQTWRDGIVQVAASDYSGLFAGQKNTIEAACDSSVIVGGYGQSIGTAATYAGILSGYENFIDGADYGAIIGGRQAKATNYGQVVHASGDLINLGDSQGTIQMVARLNQSTHIVNTWYSLYLDGAAEQMVIAASSAWTFEVMITGLTQLAAQQWSYHIIGMIERDNAGNTTLAASTVTTIFESDANYDAQVVADNVNEALEVQVRRTGGVDYNVNWTATIRTAEGGYAP